MQRRFSTHFALAKSQAELDFVDIPLDTDIRLFVDPYALSVAADPWLIECNDLVISYFELLIDTIRNDDRGLALSLLAHLHEPNDTHLGLSRGRPSGRGVGRNQADDLYEALLRSKAVKTGLLNDLSDCELHVPHISSDKISDITVNLVRGKFIDYTERQCQMLGIPTQRVASGMYWEPDRSNWTNRYASLPVYDSSRIVLVPKAAVRFRMAIDHQQYYKQYVLEYLQAEHLSAGTSLVRMLRNGKRKVSKKDLMERYPLSKDFLGEFSKKHPEVFQKYKTSRRKLRQITDEEIEKLQVEPQPIDPLALIPVLETIAVGREAASEYHRFITGALEAIFYPQLRRPMMEQEIDEGRKRIDIVFNNGAEEGFFADLRFKHGILCPYVFFECKNYTADLKNPEFDQLIGRFSDKRGAFGILVCRSVANREMVEKRCKDIVNNNKGFVLVLDDSDIKQLLQLRAGREYQNISDFMDDRFRRLVL